MDADLKLNGGIGFGCSNFHFSKVSLLNIALYMYILYTYIGYKLLC